MEAVEAWSSSRGSGSGWWRSRAAGLQLPPPDFRSRRPPPLFPPLLSSLLSQLARQGPAACPRGLYPRDFPRARASPCHSRARASRLPLPMRLFPPFFLRARDFLPGVASVGRHGDAFLHEATPYARKSWWTGRRDSEIARTTRRRHKNHVHMFAIFSIHLFINMKSESGTEILLKNLLPRWPKN